MARKSEPQVKESYIRKLERIEKEFYRNKNRKAMTVQELRKEIEGK